MAYHGRGDEEIRNEERIEQGCGMNDALLITDSYSFILRAMFALGSLLSEPLERSLGSVPCRQRISA